MRDKKAIEPLIEKWEKYARKYYQQSLDFDNKPIQQEGLFCRSEVFDYCAAKLKEILCEVKKQKN